MLSILASNDDRRSSKGSRRSILDEFPPLSECVQFNPNSVPRLRITGQSVWLVYKGIACDFERLYTKLNTFGKGIRALSVAIYDKSHLCDDVHTEVLANFHSALNYRDWSFEGNDPYVLTFNGVLFKQSTSHHWTKFYGIISKMVETLSMNQPLDVQLRTVYQTSTGFDGHSNTNYNIPRKYPQYFKIVEAIAPPPGLQSPDLDGGEHSQKKRKVNISIACFTINLGVILNGFDFISDK